MVDVPPVSSVPADPTVAQLLKLLAERDRLLAERDQLLAERDRVQAEQAELIAALTGRLAELETRLGKNSQNSSQPRARMHSSSRRRGRCAASPAASRARARAASSESRSLRSMPRRRTYRHPTRISYRASPVTVRSLSNPRAGWSLEDSVGLVLEGYTPEHVEKVTGWAARVLAAQVKPRQRTAAPPVVGND